MQNSTFLELLDHAIERTRVDVRAADDAIHAYVAGLSEAVAFQSSQVFMATRIEDGDRLMLEIAVLRLCAALILVAEKGRTHGRKAP
jgi:hypothetical protein